jgi:hypothetical protein
LPGTISSRIVGFDLYVPTGKIPHNPYSVGVDSRVPNPNVVTVAKPVIPNTASLRDHSDDDEEEE